MDHPHACGDKIEMIRGDGDKTGSSPRVWGQVNHGHAKGFRPRIIPTRVGTRSSCTVLFFCGKDHPHACGDKWYPLQEKIDARGSSPRVWGQVFSQDYHTVFTKIIPTRVGTSDERHNDRYGIEDHPHACGDKSKALNNPQFT